MDKKNNILIVIIIIIILVIVAMMTIKGRSKIPQREPLTQSEIEINNAITSDTTGDITKSLDSINLDDTSATDLQEVDKELEKL